MNCPIERGGCGVELKWDDGAFCKNCIKKVSQQTVEVKHENSLNHWVKKIDEAYARGRSDALKDAVGELKTAWVNRDGKFDINNAVAVVESLAKK